MWCCVGPGECRQAKCGGGRERVCWGRKFRGMLPRTAAMRSSQLHLGTPSTMCAPEHCACLRSARSPRECWWTGLRYTRWARAVYAAGLGYEYKIPGFLAPITSAPFKDRIAALCEWQSGAGMSAVRAAGRGSTACVMEQPCCALGGCSAAAPSCCTARATAQQRRLGAAVKACRHPPCFYSRLARPTPLPPRPPPVHHHNKIHSAITPCRPPSACRPAGLSDGRGLGHGLGIRHYLRRLRAGQLRRLLLVPLAREAAAALQPAARLWPPARHRRLPGPLLLFLLREPPSERFLVCGVGWGGWVGGKGAGGSISAEAMCALHSLCASAAPNLGSLLQAIA